MNLPNALTVGRIFLVPLLVVVLLTKFVGRLILGVRKELVGAAIFGFAHLYQGAAGVIGTGMIGFLLGAIYLLSGTLLLPIVLHTLIDARAALLTTSQPQPAISQSKPENADGFHD